MRKFELKQDAETAQQIWMEFGMEVANGLDYRVGYFSAALKPRGAVSYLYKYR